MKQWNTAIQVRPGDAVLLGGMAWLLATSPAASLRDGAKAVELAQRAARLPGVRKAESLDTLAAAYAEAGRFPEAVKTAEEAGALAARRGNRASLRPSRRGSLFIGRSFPCATGRRRHRPREPSRRRMVRKPKHKRPPSARTGLPKGAAGAAGARPGLPPPRAGWCWPSARGCWRRGGGLRPDAATRLRQFRRPGLCVREPASSMAGSRPAGSPGPSPTATAPTGIR